jgi:hypothetical protein
LENLNGGGGGGGGDNDVNINSAWKNIEENIKA